MSMDTAPMPLDALSARHGGLEEFRLSHAREIHAMLQRLQDGSVSLNLNAPDGSAISATLWAIDATRGLVSFSIDAQDPRLQGLIECDEAVVVGYIDNIKVQFDVDELVLVHGQRASALNAAYPRELFRFQRRGSYRVRPVRSLPTARLRHPALPDMELTLRVLDVSIGGCALFLPDDMPPVSPGVLVNGAMLDLDPEARFPCALRVHHVTALNAEAHGARLGCEIVKATSDGIRALQRYIDQTQKKRRLFALE